MSIVLNTTSSGYNLSAINTNFATIQDYINSTLLHRAGSVAGETLMTRDLDMNGFRILNADIDTSNITNDRAIRVPLSEGSIDPLPTADLRKGNILSFDVNTGLPIVVAPASGSATDVLNQLASNASGRGDALVSVVQPVAGAVARTQHDKNADVLSVKDFGAKGDGVTDDTLAIQAAIDYGATLTEAGGYTAIFAPTGVYRVSRIILKRHSVLYGEGRNATIFRRIDGGTLDVIYGNNSNELWNTTTTDQTGFAYNFEIHDFTVDGNMDGVVNPWSSSNTGSGIAIWGSRYRMYNIDIINCAEHGMRTDYHDNNEDFIAPWFEASIYSIRINNCGRLGWWCSGPHDAQVNDVSIINASRLGNAAYDGLWITNTMSGNFGNIHVSNGQDAALLFDNRHRFAGNIEGPVRFYGGTTFEGAWTANMRLATQNAQFEPSCTWYVPWNGTNILLDGQCSINRIEGYIGGPIPGRPTSSGIAFSGTATSINDNYINVTMGGNEKSTIVFGDNLSAPDFDKGNNTIYVKAYSNTGAGTYGVANTAAGTRLRIESNGGTPYTIDSTRQTVTIPLAAGASAVWTYPHAFRTAPTIAMTIANPVSTPTGTTWLSTLGASSCTVNNGTGTSINLVLTAFERANV